MHDAVNLWSDPQWVQIILSVRGRVCWTSRCVQWTLMKDFNRWGRFLDNLFRNVGPTRTQLHPSDNDSHLIEPNRVRSGTNADSNPSVHCRPQCSNIEWMLHFRFVCHKDGNGDCELISIDGTKANIGMVWEWEVDARIGMPINKYIPKNEVTVLFRLVPVYLDPGRLLKIFRESKRPCQ